MGIRVARAEDIPRLFTILKAAFERSKYFGRGTIDANYTKRLLLEIIARQTEAGEEQTFPFVYLEDGVIRGMHFAIKQRIYNLGYELAASDLFFYLEPGCNPFAYALLLTRFMRWVSNDERIIEIQPGVTDVIPGIPWQQVARMYERNGFHQTGAMFTREIERRAS